MIEETMIYSSIDNSINEAEESPKLFDWLFGAYISLLIATNFSQFNDLLSTFGMIIIVVFIFNFLIIQKKVIPFEAFLLGFMYLWAIFGAFNTEYKSLSITGLFFFLKVQLIILVTAFRCVSLKMMRFYLIALCIGTAFLVGLSIFGGQVASEAERLEGAAGQANASGHIAVVAFVAFSSIIFLSSNLMFRLVCVCFVALCFWMTVLTGSRGAILNVAAFMFFFLSFLWLRKGIAFKIILPLLCFLVLIGLLSLGKGTIIMERLTLLPQAIGLDVGPVISSSAAESGRIDIIEMAIKVFKDHPILGAGYGTFRVYAPVVYTHTTYFDILYSTGIVGTLLYYSVFISAFITIMKARKFFKLHNSSKYLISTEILLSMIMLQLFAGISYPTQQSKIMAPLTGIWIGMTWYFRSNFLTNQSGRQDYTE